MADAMDTLKSILGDNAEDTIRSVMDSLSSGSGDGGGASAGTGPSGGGNDAGGGLGNLLSGLNSGGNSNNGAPSPLSNIDPESLSYLMQMRDIMSKITDSRSDSRSNLLMSLKPYMRDNRKRSIDSAVRLLNISKLAGLFRL